MSRRHPLYVTVCQEPTPEVLAAVMAKAVRQVWAQDAQAEREAQQREADADARPRVETGKP
jgi:predicted CoA-binding protein